MLAIILLTATAGLPIAVIYLYEVYVLRRSYSFRQNDLLVPLGAAGLQFIASTTPYLFLERLPANFLHHAIGGGVAVAIMTLYVQRRLRPHLELWKQLLIVIAVANVLGNANEVLELVAELITGIAYITNKLDTNIDIVANNVGAVIGLVIITLLFSGKKARQ